MDDGKQESLFGRFIVAKFDNTSVLAHEIHNLVEDLFKNEIIESSLFRDNNGNSLGIFVAEMASPITKSDLVKMSRFKIKEKPVFFRIYENEDTFKKFMVKHSLSRLDNLKIPMGSQIPQVYVQGFNGTEMELKGLFQKFGFITAIHLFRRKNGHYHVIYFNSETSAMKACSIMHKHSVEGGVLIVQLLFKDASTLYFGVNGCSNVDWLILKASDYGEIEEVRTKDSQIFIKMKSIESAKAACVLLNTIHDIGSDSILRTFFIDAFFFSKLYLHNNRF